MRIVVGVGVVLAASGCLELSLPGPPGPGAVQGTAVFYRPGRASPVPAAGAKITLRNSSFATTANADGLFRIEPIDRGEGTLLLAADTNGDGAVDRQKTLSLASIGAGRGKQISVGQVTLGLNAAISGKVLRGDLGAQPGGHGATTVLVPEGPFATATADDGSFLLGELADGPLTLAFFRDGYEVVIQEVVLRSGEELALGVTRLQRTVGTAPPGSIGGRVLQPDGAALSGVVVHLASGQVERTTATTDDSGTYRFESLASGRYDLAATKTGFATGFIRNVLVAGETRVGDLVLGPGTSTPPNFMFGGGSAGGGAAGGAGGGSSGGGSSAGGAAGGGAAGGGAAAGGVAGGADGGPIAVIEPNPVIVDLTPRPDGGVIDFFVDGDRSTGDGPLRFQWGALTPGMTLEPPPSEFSSRVRYFVAPDAGTRLERIRLFVTDSHGVQTRWLEGEVRVAFRPTASLRPMSQTVGTTATLTCSGSDPGNLPLSYRFRLVSGQPMLNWPVGSNVATVTATTSGVAIVSCEVENSFGLTSEARAFITFDPSVVVGTVDAGPDLVVDAGSVVQVRAVAVGPGQYSATWSELVPGTPPLTITPDLQDPLLATFAVPHVVGGDSLRRVGLDVRWPPGCTGTPPGCLRATDELLVTILDRDGPLPVLQPPTSLGRFRSLVVEYDEDFTATPTVTLSKVSGVTLTPIIGATLRESPRRIRFVPEGGLDALVTYRFQVSAVTDTTIAANASQPLSLTVLPRQPVLSTSRSSNSVFVVGGPFPPAPGVAIISAQGTTPAKVLVAGRRDAVDQFFSFAPMPTSAPNLNGQMPLFINTVTGLPRHDGVTHRLHTRDRQVYAQLAIADFDGGVSNDGVILSSLGQGANDWTRVPQQLPGTQSPGPVAVSGGLLTSLVMTPSIIGVATAGAQGWPDFMSTPSLLEPVFNNPTGTLTGQLVAAFSSGGGVRSAAVIRGTNLQFQVGRSASLGTWETINAMLVTPSKAIRVAHVRSGTSQKVFVANTEFNAGSNVGRIDVFNGGSSLATELGPTALQPVTGLDLLRSEAGEHVYFAATVQGVGVSVSRRAGATTWEPVTSFPLTMGGCEVANPELAMTEDEGLFVTWTESCGAQNWYVWLAKID